jgi:hypothetical protein
MAATQKGPSTSWAISGGLAFSGGHGAFSSTTTLLTLFDVNSQLFIPLELRGVSVGGGLSAGLTLSTFSPNFFTTSKPLLGKDFKGQVTLAQAEMAVGIGSSLTFITFWGVDHDPYWLDIGGLEVGLSAGIGAGIVHCQVHMEAAKANDGCLIAPGGDPLCGGSSKSPNQSSAAAQSGG